MNSEWFGMALCPVVECGFVVSVQADDESDLDQSALAAFEDHCSRKHPGVPLYLHGSRFTAADTARLVN